MYLLSFVLSCLLSDWLFSSSSSSTMSFIQYATLKYLLHFVNRVVQVVSPFLLLELVAVVVVVGGCCYLIAEF